MDRTTGQITAADFLYLAITPFDMRMIERPGGHSIYVEQSGNPAGRPVVVVHGGPGGGSSPSMRRFFDPDLWRIILFDQRGCGRSVPHASVEANTTWHLIEDMEAIRTTLGLQEWVLFGGSWGATLSLAYAITHPRRVTHLVLRGVFLMTRRELQWFYGGGAGRFFPDQWRRFTDALPPAERDDLIAAYHRRLFSGNYAEEIRFGRLWAGWENALAAIQSNGQSYETPPDYARTFARLENHYFRHNGFLPEDGWILQNRAKIEGIPADIIQGRFDMICPPESAWNLAQGWEAARLQLVGMSGHAMSEPQIAKALVAVTDRLVGKSAPEPEGPLAP